MTVNHPIGLEGEDLDEFLYHWVLAMTDEEYWNYYDKRVSGRWEIEP